MQLYCLRVQPGNSKRNGNTQLIRKTDKESVRGAPACTWCVAAEEELLFALIHCESMLLDLAEGVKT